MCALPLDAFTHTGAMPGKEYKYSSSDGCRARRLGRVDRPEREVEGSRMEDGGWGGMRGATSFSVSRRGRKLPLTLACVCALSIHPSPASSRKPALGFECGGLNLLHPFFFCCLLLLLVRVNSRASHTHTYTHASAHTDREHRLRSFRDTLAQWPLRTSCTHLFFSVSFLCSRLYVGGHV